MSGNVSDRIAADNSGDYTDAATIARLLYEGGMGDGADEVTPALADGDTVGGKQAPTESSTATPATAEEAKTVDADGVLTKDGKRVIPYHVLDETRKAANQAKARAQALEADLAELRKEIEQSKAGTKHEPKTPAGEPSADYSEAKIAEVEQDFPEMAEMMRQQNAMREELRKVREATARPAAPAATDEAESVQALIDDRPMLAKWQAKGGQAWAMAVQIDAELMASPEWAGKSQAERFDAVQARVADELGIDLPAVQPKPAAAPPKVAKAALPGVGDFSGRPVITSNDPFAGKTAGQAVDVAMAMTPEEIYRMCGIPV